MSDWLIAIITVAAMLLVPFVTFYLDRKDLPQPVDGSASYRAGGISVSPTTRIIFVSGMALVFAVPVGLMAYCTIFVFNVIFAPLASSVWLYSLDAGLSAGAMFALSLILHSGFHEPRQWWDAIRWYSGGVATFFGSLGFLVALIGNVIWGMAQGLDFVEYGVVHDSLDAGVASAVVAWIAAYASIEIERLRGAPNVAPAE